METRTMVCYYLFSSTDRFTDCIGFYTKLDGHYQYWEFMLSICADRYCWSDQPLPLVHSVPPPFTQAECQGILIILCLCFYYPRCILYWHLHHGFSAAPQSLGIQTIIHMRFVSQILLHITCWHQTYYYPHKALPHNAHKGHYHLQHNISTS